MKKTLEQKQAESRKRYGIINRLPPETTIEEVVVLQKKYRKERRAFQHKVIFQPSELNHVPNARPPAEYSNSTPYGIAAELHSPKKSA